MSELAERSKTQRAMDLVVRLVLDGVREAGTFGVASSTFFLAFQTQGMSLRVYNDIVGGLVELGLVELRNDRLYWPGGKDA